MRAKRTAQTSLFDPQVLDHPVADELEWASAWLDAHPELLDEIAADPDGGVGSSLGRHGLTRETILRCAVLMHLRGESYRGLAFTLRDSLSAQRFARLDPTRRAPGKSVLQATVGAIGAATWEAINRTLLAVAHGSGVEMGKAVRVDSTVTETHILEPSDSRLLFDGVRVLTRLLRKARDELGASAIDFHDHCRAAKRRALEVGSQRGAQRRAKTYRKLLRLTGRTMGYIEAALPAVAVAGTAWSRGWVETATAYLDLLGKVTDQTERRVFDGETVPAGEKVVSLFEPHTRHHRQGRPRDALRPQDQPGHGAERAGARRGGGGRQPARTARVVCRCFSGISSTTARRRRGWPSMAATLRARISTTPRRWASSTSCSTRSAA